MTLSTVVLSGCVTEGPDEPDDFLEEDEGGKADGLSSFTQPILNYFNAEIVLSDHRHLCVRSAGGLVEAVACQQSNVERWAVSSTGEIRNLASGTCLTEPPGAAVGARLTATPCTGAVNQRWRFAHEPGGPRTRMLVQSMRDGRCMDVAAWNGPLQPDLISYPCHGGPNQRFAVTLQLGSAPALPSAAWNDPVFEPGWCANQPAMTLASARSKLPAGTSSATLGGYQIAQRQRTCGVATGCGPWGVSNQPISSSCSYEYGRQPWTTRHEWREPYRVGTLRLTRIAGNIVALGESPYFRVNNGGVVDGRVHVGVASGFTVSRVGAEPTTTMFSSSLPHGVPSDVAAWYSCGGTMPVHEVATSVLLTDHCMRSSFSGTTPTRPDGSHDEIQTAVFSTF